MEAAIVLGRGGIMKKAPAALASIAIVAAIASTAANAAETRWWNGDWSGAFAAPHFYYLPFYHAPYGFTYVGNPDFPGCYFARRSGPHGSYLVPVC